MNGTRPSGSLELVRIVTLVSAISLVAFASAQVPQGTYRPAGGTATPWRISSGLALIWDGKPYLPVGLHIDGTTAEVERAKAGGISDVIVDLPDSGIGWAPVLKALNDAKMRFILSINSAAPLAYGIAVEPRGYRITGITEKRRITATFPGAKSVFAILLTSRDMSIESSVRVQTPNGKFDYAVEPGSDIDHVLVLYPEGPSLQQPDLWDAMDAHRDALLAAIKANNLGPGLRGVLNPGGVTVNLAGQHDRFVPTSAMFRFEFQAYLETRYRNIDTLGRSWSMSSSDIDSFEVAARMVPLWSGKGGISAIWDPETDKTYPVDLRHSSIWADIDLVVDSAFARRYSRLVTAIRSSVDVPVIQDWMGWSPPYEPGAVGVDGVGTTTLGSAPSEVLATASRAASSVLRWDHPGWFVATRIDVSDSANGASQLSNVFDDLSSLGVRGWFARTSDPATAKALSDEATKRAADAAIAQTTPNPLFFPENALNPATPQSLPGGHWWLPTPGDGNRVDLGADFNAYRFRDGRGTNFVMWTTAAAKRVKLFMTSTKGVHFQTLDGADPQPKPFKGGVEVLVGQYPLVISGTEEIPVPKPTYDTLLSQIAQLLDAAGRSHKDVTEEQYFTAGAVEGFSRNPGGSYTSLRTICNKLTLKLARYSWIEAESSRNTTFSEVRQIEGLSGGAALALETDLRMNSVPYFAEYQADLAREQDYEVWIAAKIPRDKTKDVRVVFGGQALGIDGPPVAQYGAGFGWYRLGITQGVGLTKFKLMVDAQQGISIAVDAIVLYPGSFQPNGVRLPNAMIFVDKPLKPAGPGGTD